ncbi:hypothetical protein GQ53DRAFT_861785 [Thozetella sp. PMI_491]|nr:hypothetical protein GQ53DRAFT_861785 [Thozetella sp. PMI_491]
MTDLNILLYEVSEVEDGGHLRASPEEQKILFAKGEFLTAKATIALLYHGTLTPKGDPASLLVVDFRFVSEKPDERFINARMKLGFRDQRGEDLKSPVVYRIAPEDKFTIEPGMDTWKITQTFDTGGDFQFPGFGGFKFGGGLKREGEKNNKHSIVLTGKKKLETGGYQAETAAIWRMYEDDDKPNGIPSVLRTAMLLKRQPGRSFKIDIEIETKANWTTRFANFLGGTEHCVPLEDVEVNPDRPSHVVVDGDEWISAWVEKATKDELWTKLGQLNLQSELVQVTNEKMMANQVVPLPTNKAPAAGKDKAPAADGNEAHPPQ